MEISSLSPGNRDIREILLRTGARSILGPESPSVLLFPLNPVDEQRIESIFHSIAQETELAGRGSAELILLRLSELALLLERHEAEVHPIPDVRAGACRPEDIDTWLRKHFTEAMNLDQIAHALGYSPAWLSRLYRARTGTCLFEEVNRLRIERACYLLKYSEKSVTDIAFEVGYNNVSFFNRMFRRHLAVNPAAFRARSK
jgi:AraC-like DNA-binding protein